MPERTVKIALVGAGMFGGDVHLRAYADVQRSGLAPYVGRLGHANTSSVQPRLDGDFRWYLSQSCVAIQRHRRNGTQRYTTH